MSEQNEKLYLTADEAAKMMGVSKSHVYKVMRHIPENPICSFRVLSREMILIPESYFRPCVVNRWPRSFLMRPIWADDCSVFSVSGKRKFICQ